MTTPDFIELSARCEALARTTLCLASQLAGSGAIDEERFSRQLRAARPSGSSALDRAAALIDELVCSLAAARSPRQRPVGLVENRNDPKGGA